MFQSFAARGPLQSIRQYGPALGVHHRPLIEPACTSASSAWRHSSYISDNSSNSTFFTSKPHFRKSYEVLPTLRLLGEDGQLVPGASLPFSLDHAVGMHETMVRVSTVDQILNSLQRQGRISFYMTGNGEEAAQVGTVAALDSKDVIWAQYRELGTFMHRGFTVQQIVDQCMSRSSDPGKGRQMPVHYCDANLQMQAVTSPLATQIPQAVGAGYAFRVGGEPRCAIAYFGEGAASEGDFAVACNFAATLRSQTLFLCRNNGWAISTPSNEQYAGDGVAVRGVAYGLHTIRVDGNDLAAVFLATQKARAFRMSNGEPAILELMTYRRGHHSTSDDATRYRPGQEAKSMARAGLEPISRMRVFLSQAGRWDEASEESLRARTRDEVMDALKRAEAKKFAPVADMFNDVWAEQTPELKRQHAELREHLKQHEGKYKSLMNFEQ